MAVQATKISWKWNYFVEVTNGKAKCIICNESIWFRKDLQSGRYHLETNHINNDQNVSSQLSSSNWKSRFTAQNDGMKCKLCDQICPTSKVVKLEMTRHLETTHKINENTITQIIKYKYNKTCDKNRKITYICNKCNYTHPSHSSNFTLIKHLIDNHRTDLPAKMRPRRLYVLSSLLNYDEEAGIATPNNSQPNVYSFDANRLSELSSSSNCDGETGIPTSINYQQPNVYSLDTNRLCEISNPINYGGEAGIVTSINYQQPYQLYNVLNSPLNYNGEAGIAASINYQQPIQLYNVLNSPLNYNGEAGIAASINYQQPIQLCALSSPLNYNGEAGIAASINYQQPIQLCEISNPSNSDGEANIVTSINYQQPTQLCVLNSPLNYNGEASIAASINYQQPIQLCASSSPLIIKERLMILLHQVTLRNQSTTA